MEVTDKKQDVSEDHSKFLKTDKPADNIIKKEPDEEQPSILGNPPNLLDVPPVKNEGEDFKHLHNDEELLEEPGKVDDGLL